jgi:hypothetical protein
VETNIRQGSDLTESLGKAFNLKQHRYKNIRTSGGRANAKRLARGVASRALHAQQARQFARISSSTYCSQPQEAIHRGSLACSSREIFVRKCEAPSLSAVTLLRRFMEKCYQVVGSN